MNTKFLYGTVASAVNILRDAGFNSDFSLEESKVACSDKKIDIEDLKIVSVSRYEGNSDPGDGASVYGLESKTGLKGILVTGDGIYSDAFGQTLKKLHAKINLEAKT
jgi:hypothetical protein